MKKYLQVYVTRTNGTVFQNPLKLSEVHLISPMAQENRHLEVKAVHCDSKTYKSIFG